MQVQEENANSTKKGPRPRIEPTPYFLFCLFFSITMKDFMYYKYCKLLCRERQLATGPGEMLVANGRDCWAVSRLSQPLAEPKRILVNGKTCNDEQRITKCVTENVRQT